MAYQIHKNVMPDPKARRAFDALASQVFGLSFEDWYAAGYWTASNLPYTLFDGDTRSGQRLGEPPDGSAAGPAAPITSSWAPS